jgi:tetratricopeptide (TPR) repeat protein
LFYGLVQAQDQWQFTSQELKMYNQIIEGSCQPLQIDGNSPASLYLNNLQETIALLFSEDESAIDNYEVNYERQLEAIERIKTQSPFRDFYHAEIRLRAAFVYLKFDRQFESGWQFRQAFRLIEKNIASYPEFLPNYKTIGLMHILVGSVPEKYRWVLSLAGLNGSIKDGEAELNRVIEAESPFKLEALLLLSLCEAYILQEPEDASKRLMNFGNNTGSLITLAKMSVYMKNSQSELATVLFDSIKTSGVCIAPIKYMAAEAYLQKGDYAKASVLYSQYIADFNGYSNIKDSYYKLYLCKYLSNDTTGQQDYLYQAKKIKKEATEADRYAGKIIKSQKAPNPDILKIRLATDGGFYETAKKILENDPKLYNRKDSLEIIYREARLAHKTGKTQIAIERYKAVINFSGNENWYFAPNSALMLGHIYFELGETEKAKAYFLKAKTYKHHEYKNSIDTKAEAALNLLKVP